MSDILKRLASLAAICAVGPVFASDVDSPFVDNASALIAIQLSAEVGDGLSSELVGKGMTRTEADALVFRVVDGAARCVARGCRRI